MARSNIRDMTEGSPTRLIVLFALPLILGNLGQQLYNVVDAIVVGQGVGVSALAALGATDWIYWFFLWSIKGLSNGFSVLHAQRFGAKDAVGLRKAFTMATLLSLAIGIFLTVLGLVLAKPLLLLLKTPGAIFDDAYAYLATLFTGIWIVVAYNVSAGVLRALGDGKTPLVSMLIASAINIVLDLAFVLWFGWGIVGAAVATVIAQLFSFLYCLRALLRIEILRTEVADWKIDRAMIGRLCGLGLPLAAQSGFIAIGGMVLQSVLNGFGYLIVAGFTATNKLYGILESTGISLGQAMSTYTGQNMGAKKLDRIKAGMKAVRKVSIIISVSISVLMILLGRHILSLFVSSTDPNATQVLDTAYLYLFIMCITLVILYLLHDYRSALQGMGNTFFPLLSGILEFAMRVGVALLLPPLIGEMGIFFAEPAAWLGANVALFIGYYREIARLERTMGKEEGIVELA